MKRLTLDGERLMAIKNIVVHQDRTKNCATRLKVAAAIGKQHGAHIKVVFARGGWKESISESAQDAKAEFQTLMAGVDAEWVEADAFNPDKNLVDQLLWHTRHSDMVIVGQYNEHDHGFAPKTLVEQMMLESGRPVLVIPHVWKLATLGDRVMVAWDRKRESTRAVNDALPLLQQASLVELVAVTSKKPAPDRKFDRCADLATHLGYHGITAVTNNLIARDIDIANLLLSIITDGDIDMVVMGGYGHARLRETVLGGVTKDLLAQMPVPVLMSH